LRGAPTSGSVTLRTGATALAAGSYKMLALFGGTADGTGLQSNHMSCPAVVAGRPCEQ
jgi:X-X-X-Leu-X-X-Gly heptad repeat protein